jgi:hypothetical protein
VAKTVTVYRDPAASETAVAHPEPVASETATAKSVSSAAKTTAMASTPTTTATTASPCERGCAGRRCRYAENDCRSCCDHLFAHFFQTPVVSLNMDSLNTTAVLVLL